MFSTLVSPVLAEARSYKNMDHAAYMEFEFMNRVPVRPDFFTEMFDNHDVVQVLATNCTKSSMIPIMAFLDIEVTQARVYYLRVMSMLSSSEIKAVLKDRDTDPVLPNNPTLVDLMTFVTQFDRLIANPNTKGRVPTLLQRYGLSRALQVEEVVPTDYMKDILGMLISCLTYLAEKDSSIKFIVRGHIQSFKTRLISL